MSSYDEHLISMAGGDGDPLDQISKHKAFLDRAHRMSCSDPSDPARTTTYSESASAIEALLALVRTQQAILAAVLNLANTSGRCGWRISADQLRRTLRGES